MLKKKKLKIIDCIGCEKLRIELESKDCIRWTMLVDLCVNGTQVICGVAFQANLCPFCVCAVSRREVENLLSNGNLSSFWEMAIYTYTVADQSVCWYVVCGKKCTRICIGRKRFKCMFWSN